VHGTLAPGKGPEGAREWAGRGQEGEEGGRKGTWHARSRESERPLGIRSTLADDEQGPLGHEAIEEEAHLQHRGPRPRLSCLHPAPIGHHHGLHQALVDEPRAVRGLRLPPALRTPHRSSTLLYCAVLHDSTKK